MIKINILKFYAALLLLLIISVSVASPNAPWPVDSSLNEKRILNQEPPPEQVKQAEIQQKNQGITDKTQELKDLHADQKARKKEHQWIIDHLPNFQRMRNLRVSDCERIEAKFLKLSTATNFLGLGNRVVGQNDSYTLKQRAWKCGGNAYVCSFNANNRVAGCKTYRW